MYSELDHKGGEVHHHLGGESNRPTLGLAAIYRNFPGHVSFVVLQSTEIYPPIAIEKSSVGRVKGLQLEH
jgi:hypothetical protein